MRRTVALLLLITSLTLGGACGGGEGGDGDGDGASSKPKVEIPDGAPPSELQIRDIKMGTGAEASVGKELTVHYVGVTWSEKEQFDASWDRPGGPASYRFKLGARQTILGWEAGLEGMKVGGRRELIIPPDMAYGELGYGDAIKPNETLVFVIDLLDVT